MVIQFSTLHGFDLKAKDVLKLHVQLWQVKEYSSFIQSKTLEQNCHGFAMPKHYHALS